MEEGDRTTTILAVHANASAMGTLVEHTTRVQLMHNDRPRKILNWPSPAHALHYLFSEARHAS